MTFNLHAKQTGEGPAVILLHGLLGAGGNLGALARALQDKFTVFSVDLPNHGRSAWLNEPNLFTMAKTLQQWMDGQGLRRAHTVGHSLGGKVAMQLALDQPERVESLVVADIAPVSYSAHHDAVFAALSDVEAAECTSREQATGLMTRHLSGGDAFIQFLLMSLRRDPEGIYRWRFDVQGLKTCYSSMLAAPNAGQSYPGPSLFVKGGTSHYIEEKHWPVIQKFFPDSSIKVLPGCGHWLHVEKPQLFNGIVERFLVSVKPSMLSPER